MKLDTVNKFIYVNDKIFSDTFKHDTYQEPVIDPYFLKKYAPLRMDIVNVIFNDPATIIIWADGTKTVVKCGKRDDYDPEKGLAMAIAKKALGNSGNYYNEIRKWLPKEKEPVVEEKNGKDYTIKEYCALHNCTKNKVYRMIMNGEISAVKDSKGHWIVFE